MPALKLLQFDNVPAVEQPAITPKSRTREIQREYIPGYPRTLFIYRTWTPLVCQALNRLMEKEKIAAVHSDFFVCLLATVPDGICWLTPQSTARIRTMLR